MTRSLPATLQTVYAELVERCSIEQMASDFPAGGSFYKQKQRGGVFWYYRSAVEADGARRDRYVGPDTEELQGLIERHKEAKREAKERRSMVVALQGAGLLGPDPMTGRVLQAFAEAGVFRLRGVVVGSVAFQTYGALLGRVFSAKSAQTQDLDLAQFLSISLQVNDAVDIPLLASLKKVDARFRAVPLLDGHKATSFALGQGRYRVEILTPNRGPDSDDPVALPALKSDALPLRFLDFLIYNEVKAVVLYGDGVLINVPAPERYALHKLLVSRARAETPNSQAKAQKDLRQAAELIKVLVEQRPYELRDVWQELTGRGKKWQQYATEAVTLLDQADNGSSAAREGLMRVVGSPR